MTGLPEALVVFGASGFLGRNFVRHMQGRIARLVAVTGSSAHVPEAHQTVPMADLDAIAPLPRGTVAVSFAAHRYDAARLDQAQTDVVTGNTALANRVFGFCREREIEEVRWASSVAVYPASLSVLDDAIPLDLNALPNPSEAFYAWSKRWSEIVARLYRERYGINTIGFRLSNPYGAFDSTDPSSAHVLPAFVMRALENTPTFTIKGNPLVERDFIYAADVVEVFERSLALRGVSDELNLCRGETTTLLALAQTILAVAGIERRIDAFETSTQGVLARRSTNERLRTRFGGMAFTSLLDGLGPTIDWYRNAHA